LLFDSAELNYFYHYDDKGFRYMKEDDNGVANGVATGNKTYYVRDAGGTLLSVYTATGTQTPQQQEVMLYGSGRLGMAYKNGSNYEYICMK